MAIPLYQSSIDKALASGKTPEQLRAILSNNPTGKVAITNGLKYLDSIRPVASKIPDATTGPYTKQNAENAMNTQSTQQASVIPNSITNPSKPNDYSLGETSSTNSWVDRLNTTMDEYASNAKKTATETEANARKAWQEASTVTAQRDAEKLIRTANQEAELKDIKDTRETNIEQRRKDAEVIVNIKDNSIKNGFIKLDPDKKTQPLIDKDRSDHLVIPVHQRVVDRNGKSIFLADVEVVNLETNNVIFKTRTNGTGKWMASLSPGNYNVIIQKRESVSKEKIKTEQLITVDAGTSLVELQMIILKWKACYMSYSVVDGFGDKCYFEDSIYQSLDNKVMAYNKTYSVLWLTGVRHREDGPAVEYANGNKEWYYHGKHVSCKDNEEFLKIIKMIAFL